MEVYTLDMEVDTLDILNFISKKQKDCFDNYRDRDYGRAAKMGEDKSRDKQRGRIEESDI